MWTKRITMRVLAGLALVGGLAGTAKAQVKADEILARRPVQAGVAVTMPVGPELAACRAEQVAWPKPATGPAPTGVVVKDSQGRLVRQFIDTAGGSRPNIFSFYLNGVESYREVDSNSNGKPDQFRWLGPNGGKWGADPDEDGRIDTWYVLSPEEVSQELFFALQTKDAKRIESLLPSEQELKALGLPETEIAKVRQRAGNAVKRMQDTADALKLTDKAKWIHLELGLPHVTPGDSFGSREDLVKHRSATILVDPGDGKVITFQTGEIVQVGRTWKVIDGPAPGGAPIGGGGTADIVGIDVPAEARPLLEQLEKVPPAEHAKRAALLEEIVKVAKGAQQEPWLKQMIDSYSAAAETGDAAALQKLKAWMGQIDSTAPKSAVAAYAQYRILSAENSLKSQTIKTEAQMQDVQKWWREQLEAFIQKHPTAEDTPEAMNRLAWSFEYAKDGEAQAKQWYERLGREFASHPYGMRAPGAIKRLTSEGQPFALAGQTLDGKAFNVAQLNGKAVIVYYWASWGRDTANELKQLAELAKVLGPKGLEIVTVNLDEEQAKAVTALNAAQLPGSHLYAVGGLDRSPLAMAYGIQMVPHLFLIGKDGKVTNRNAQTGSMLKDDVEKLLK